MAAVESTMLHQLSELKASLEQTGFLQTARTTDSRPSLVPVVFFLWHCPVDLGAYSGCCVKQF